MEISHQHDSAKNTGCPGAHFLGRHIARDGAEAAEAHRALLLSGAGSAGGLLSARQRPRDVHWALECSSRGAMASWDRRGAPGAIPLNSGAIEGSRLEEALALYQGDLLPGFFLSDSPEFERWLEGERFAFARARDYGLSPSGQTRELAARIRVRQAKRAAARSSVDRICHRGRVSDARRRRNSGASRRPRSTMLRSSDNGRGLLAR